MTLPLASDEFVEHLSRALRLDLDTPWAKPPKKDRDLVMLGSEAVSNGTRDWSSFTRKTCRVPSMIIR